MVVLPYYAKGLERALLRAVAAGLKAAALVDREGTAVAVAGEIDADTATPLVTLALYRNQGSLASSLLAGEIISADLGEPHRTVAVGIAKRQLFVLAVLGEAKVARVKQLRNEIEGMLADSAAVDVPWAGGASGSGSGGSGPAELPLIELGITVKRPRAKA